MGSHAGISASAWCLACSPLHCFYRSTASATRKNKGRLHRTCCRSDMILCFLHLISVNGLSYFFRLSFRSISYLLQLMYPSSLSPLFLNFTSINVSLFRARPAFPSSLYDYAVMTLLVIVRFSAISTTFVPYLNRLKYYPFPFPKLQLFLA